MSWVGVDVGGSKVLAGVVDEHGRVLQTACRRTPGERAAVAEVEQTVVAAVREVTGTAAPGTAACGLAGVGVAAAGFVDVDRERVAFAPHLPWRGDPVRQRVEQALGVPVLLENDANAAALGEHRHGTACGAGTAVVLTLGTGIGGAVLAAGRLYRGRNGMAGELGHVPLVPDGRACPCGGRGCWEQYASGPALERAAAEAALRLPVAERPAWYARGADTVTGRVVADAAAGGEPVALAACREVGDWLGRGVAMLVAAGDPDVVVLGGGLAAAGELLMGPAREALARTLVAREHRVLPDLVPATLGVQAAVVGAACLARESVG